MDAHASPKYSAFGAVFRWVWMVMGADAPPKSEELGRDFLTYLLTLLCFLCKEWCMQKWRERVIRLSREIIQVNTSFPPGNETVLAGHIANMLSDLGFETII
jgi:hypothetical protein